MTITAKGSVSSTDVPASLQSYTVPSCTATNTCLLNNMAIYDQSNVAITMGGNSNLNFTGNIYVPNAAVTFQGNPTVSACGELIANSVAFNGNATFDDTGCASTFHTQTPTTQLVTLVN